MATVAVVVLAFAWWAESRKPKALVIIVLVGLVCGLYGVALDHFSSILDRLGAGVAALGFFAYLAHKSLVGWGDAGVIALIAFLLGWRVGLYGITYGCLIGAFATLIWHLWNGTARGLFGRGGKATRIQFMPFLLAGTIIAVVTR